MLTSESNQAKTTYNFYYFKHYLLSIIRVLLIIFLPLFVITSCKSRKLPREQVKPESYNQEDDVESITMSVDKTQLRSGEKAVKVEIKIVGKDQAARLEDFTFKVGFLEEPVFDSNISYKNAANQKQITSGFNMPLLEFLRLSGKTIDPNKQQQNIRIELYLNASKQVSKLRLGIELANKQSNDIKKQEVVWRKGNLIIAKADKLDGSTIGNVILKNATPSPIEPDTLELTLSSTQGIRCQFVKTNRNIATLRQLLDLGTELLASDADTAPIQLQVINADEVKKGKITITITQVSQRLNLGTYTIDYENKPKPFSNEGSPAPEKNRRQRKASTLNQEKTIPPQTPSSVGNDCKPNKNDNTSLSSETKNSPKDVEQSNKQPKVTLNKNGENRSSLQKESTTRHQEGLKQETDDLNLKHKSVTNQESTISTQQVISEQATRNKAAEPYTEQASCNIIQPTAEQELKTNVKGNNSDTYSHQRELKESQSDSPKAEAAKNNAALSTDQEKIEVIVPEEKEPSSKVTNTTADSIIQEAQPKETNAKPTLIHRPKQKENINKQQEKASNAKEKGMYADIPDLQMNIDPIKNEEGEISKRFKIRIINVGERLSQEALNKVTFGYKIKENGKLVDCKLKKRRNSIEVQGAELAKLLKSRLSASNSDSFELIIDTKNAEELTIKLFLKGTKQRCKDSIKWLKAKKTSAKTGNNKRRRKII